MEVIRLLGLNWNDFLWHLVNFIVLIFLITRFLYKPMVGLLDERQRRIRESLEAADRARAEAEESDRQRELILAETRREIQEMMTQAQQTAAKIQEDARAQATEDARRIVETARREAEAERAQAMADLRREVAGLAVLAAERVIGQSMNDQAHRRLVDDFLVEAAATDGRRA
jgi:F-type H+-transporting ATPase subunit b